MALAVSAASKVWGGYGFIYIPHRSGEIHPAIKRVLREYDPDYLVELGYSCGDVDAMKPGWIASRMGDISPDDENYAAFFDQIAEQPAFEVYEDHGPGAELCSPYRERGDHLKMHMMSEDRAHPLLKWSEFDGTRPVFEVPDGIDPLLMLAIAKRSGFTTKPALPLGAVVDGVQDRLPEAFLNYALSLPKPRRGTPASEDLAGLSTAWEFSQRGLTPVMRARPESAPTAVIGSTAEDFALAVALDRMYGSTTWIPEDWCRDEALRMRVYLAFSSLESETWNSGNRPIVTSISVAQADLQAIVSARWPAAMQAWDQDRNPVPLRDTSPVLRSPEDLNLRSPLHLACGPGDYDRTAALPTRADGEGGFEYVFALPPEVPANDDLRGPNRPFWEVDVEVDRVAIPPGRDLAGSVMLADGQHDRGTVLRSGRDGISFNPSSMLFVPAGATISQAIAKPRLHALGLQEWVRRLVSQNEPETKVNLSQAGRRAAILTQLWGSRSAVARDLLELDVFLREFKPEGASDIACYEHRDGVRLTPTEGYLTFAAATRTLPGVPPADLRKKVNDLLHINVLHRGLIVRCSKCERRAFYRIDLVSERNECSRCGATAFATDAWRSSLCEPEWYYDLHGAVRELLEQNGDVPFLAGLVLAGDARTFEEVAELDFVRSGDAPDEIDVVALVDGRLVIGEAKCVSNLGDGREASQGIAKLVRTADLLGADEILLATTSTEEWKKANTDALLGVMRDRVWRYGSAPQLRVITSLRDTPLNALVPNS